MFREMARSVALTAGILTFAAACAESPVSPGRGDLAAPAFSVGVPPAPTGALQTTLVSGGTTTQYCGFAGLNVFNTATACAPGSPSVQIAHLNPGWVTTIDGANWIGVQADADAYVMLPGAYTFERTFTVPAGSTDRQLNLQIAADNNVSVYLNGTLLGMSATPDAFTTSSPASIFDAGGLIVDGVNTLRFVVNNTRVNNVANNVDCASRPAGYYSSGIYAGPYDAAACRNPSALLYSANVYWNVAPPRTVALFVIGDAEAHALGNNVNFWGAQWWKNNQMSGFVSNGVAAFKGYATTSDNVCGGTWQSLPGNSSNPPDVIGADVAIIVTSTVVKNGPNISGDIKQILIVHQDGGYGPNPGHAGNGPVTTVVCTAH